MRHSMVGVTHAIAHIHKIPGLSESGINPFLIRSFSDLRTSPSFPLLQAPPPSLGNDLVGLLEWEAHPTRVKMVGDQELDAYRPDG